MSLLVLSNYNHGIEPQKTFFRVFPIPGTNNKLWGSSGISPHPNYPRGSIRNNNTTRLRYQDIVGVSLWVPEKGEQMTT